MADGQPLTRPAAKPQQSVNADVWSALCAAQEEFEAIGKTTRGARSKYAPLDEVLDTLRPVLTKHGLASTSLPFVEGEAMLIRRVLAHAESKTQIECVYPVAHISRPPQEIGSALTYARRYSLLAICDVHPTDEDDDGEKANAKPAAQTKSAHALRKENVWPKIIADLKKVVTVKDFKAWEDANAELVSTFPPQWNVELQDEIAAHKEWLAEQREMARQAAEHV